MLISLHAQSTLGFVKDVQAGTCMMRYLTGEKPSDFEMVEVTLYNLKGSGLRAICISDFFNDSDIEHDMQELAPSMSFASLERSGSASARKTQGSAPIERKQSRSKLHPWYRDKEDKERDRVRHKPDKTFVPSRVRDIENLDERVQKLATC